MQAMTNLVNIYERYQTQKCLKINNIFDLAYKYLLFGRRQLIEHLQSAEWKTKSNIRCSFIVAFIF